MADQQRRETQLQITQYAQGAKAECDDVVAVEEPMEIRIVYGPADQRAMRSLAVTMRTPGHDKELAAGFLHTESIITSPAEIEAIQLRGVAADGTETGNTVRVDLKPEVEFDSQQLQRHFFTTSSCGVCGKSSLEALHVKGLTRVSSDLRISNSLVYRLPEILRTSQPTFAQTGGLHAAGIFDSSGKLLSVREDVGRHNAVDKVIGDFFLRGETRLSQFIMMVSGRASFEIMQKALVAGVPVVVAVGAPSSLAVDIAREYGMTLVGFASNTRFNVYSGTDRITAS